MKQTAATFLLIITALAAPASPLAARQDERPPRWAATADIGVNASRGNSQLTAISSALGVRHLVADEFRLEWTGALRYGESEGEVVARSLRSQVSFDLNPHATLSPFFFASAERDRFRRISLRSDGGAGAKYTFWRDGDQELSLSMAGLYSRQAFFPLATGEATPTRNDARWSARGRVRRSLGDARVEHVSFFQPVLDRAADYNYDATTRLATRISDRVAFTLSHVYRHNSRPAAGVGREDQIFQAGVAVEF
jgi:hypothetical protein